MIISRLLRRADFLRVRGGRSCRTPSLIVQARPRGGNGAGDAIARFGFTASRRLGGAARRNRARRRLKEAVRLVGPVDARAGYDYVVIARAGALTHSFNDIVKELRTALRRVAEERKPRGPGR